MPQDKKQKETLLQNLEDAGCTHAIIEQFIKSYEANNITDQISILARHRNSLLSRVHKEQDKLDCLDCLLFQLKKEKKTIIPSTHTHIHG